MILLRTVKTLALSILSFLFITLPSHAHAAAGWTDYMVIAELVPTSKPYYEVKVPVKSNPSGCLNPVWFYQSYKTKGSDKMFETLLEGLQEGNRVRLYVTGRCNVNGYSEFTSVGILP